jgi:type I restriction enzyme S subunit
MSWEKETISNALTTIRFPRSCQILSSEIKPFGKYPVIDQGQSFIAGYSDYSEKVISEYLPVIIFGDHTRAVKYVDFPFIIGADGTKVLKPKPDYEAKFFYYALLFIDIPSRGYNRHFSVLKEKVIPKPPLPEQRKIAAILSTVQKAIETENKLIERTRELKKAMMHKLFTEGTRGEKQKMTEIGPIPESWEVVRLGDLGDCITGTTPRTSIKDYYQPEEFDFIGPADLGKTKFVYESINKISFKGLSVARVLPKNTVMFVCIGSTIGKTGITYKEISCTNQQINSIICNEKYNFNFVYYLLTFYSNYIKNISSFGPKNILSKGQFIKIKIPVTFDKTEQQQIADMLSTIDQKIEYHTTKKQKLEDLFRTLLHELMTAKIRVNEVELKEVIK